MAISDELSELNGLVYRLLTVNPKYRDNDKMLCAKIWSMQMGGMENTKMKTAFDFLAEYAKPDSMFYSQESIGRCRRKIQEENVSLRGKKYNQRNEQTKAVQTKLGYY